MWLSWENQTFLNTCNHLALSEKIKNTLRKTEINLSGAAASSSFFFPFTVEFGVPQWLHLFFHKHIGILTHVLKAVRHLLRCTGWRPCRLETRDTPSERPCDALQPTSPQSDLSHNRQEARLAPLSSGRKGCPISFNKNQTAGRDRGALQIKH